MFTNRKQIVIESVISVQVLQYTGPQDIRYANIVSGADHCIQDTD